MKSLIDYLKENEQDNTEQKTADLNALLAITDNYEQGLELSTKLDTTLYAITDLFEYLLGGV